MAELLKVTFMQFVAGVRLKLNHFLNWAAHQSFPEFFLGNYIHLILQCLS